MRQSTQMFIMDDLTALTENNIEPTSDEINSLRNLDWYIALKDDVDSDLTETEFDVNTRLIEMHHRLGKRIVENIENFKRSNIYGKHIAEIIAQDIGRHPSVVRRAIQFYNKTPDLQKFLEDKPKNYSWYKVRTEYLPEKKKIPETSEIKEPALSPVLSSPEESAPIQNTVNLEEATFTLQNCLDLYIDIINSVPLLSRNIIPEQFTKLLKDKYSNEDIINILNIYSKNKSREKIVFLKELESIAVPTSTNLFGEEQPQQNQPTKLQTTEKQNPTALLVFHYKQLYKKKFNQEPVVNTTSWAKWGKRLKDKLSQGYTIEEIISLLQIFANSKDSENLSFDPAIFLSDFVFNKMVQVKNKGNKIVLEGKYGKY